MVGELRHRTYHLQDRVHHTIENAFWTSGAVLMLLALLALYIGLVAAK